MAYVSILYNIVCIYSSYKTLCFVDGKPSTQYNILFCWDEKHPSCEDFLLLLRWHPKPSSVIDGTWSAASWLNIDFIIIHIWVGDGCHWKRVYYTHRSQEEGMPHYEEGVCIVYAQWKALGSTRKQRKERKTLGKGLCCVSFGGMEWRGRISRPKVARLNSFSSLRHKGCLQFTWALAEGDSDSWLLMVVGSRWRGFPGSLVIRSLSNAGVSRAGDYGVISPECREPVQEVVESVVTLENCLILAAPPGQSRPDVKASGYEKEDAPVQTFPRKAVRGLTRTLVGIRTHKIKSLQLSYLTPNFLEVTSKGMEEFTTQFNFWPIVSVNHQKVFVMADGLLSAFLLLCVKSQVPQ